MRMTIIVEGKNDCKKLRRLLQPSVQIICTFGTPSTKRLAALQKQIGRAEVFIFTDNDASGKKIRYMLNEWFPEAKQIYTRRGYAGVEGTPDEYLIQQLDKHGLTDWLIPANIGD